jgi:hypothetical protein
MKISELKEPLKSLAEQRRKERTDSFYKEFSDQLGDAFNWSQTREGYNFWSDVDDEKDVSNHPNYPKQETKLFLAITERPDTGSETHILEHYSKDEAFALLGFDPIEIVYFEEIKKNDKPTVIF